MGHPLVLFEKSLRTLTEPTYIDSNLILYSFFSIGGKKLL